MKIILILSLVFSQALFAQSEFEFPEPKRLVAFGDLHGDFDAMVAVLEGMGLIDKRFNWTGGDTWLVSMGDLFDRGDNSRAIIDLIIKLEKQALQAGGRVFTLLGNHEAMVLSGDLRYFSWADVAKYDSDFHATKSKVVAKFFHKDGIYAEWMASRPTAIKIGRKLFVHAGVESWLARVSLSELNRHVTDWIKYYQKNGPRPSYETEWVLRDEGPLWTRKLAESEIDPRQLSFWLESQNADTVVVGHSITSSLEPVLRTRAYGRQLMMIDTGMSFAYDGNLSAVEWKDGEEAKPFLFKRPWRSSCAARVARKDSER